LSSFGASKLEIRCEAGARRAGSVVGINRPDDSAKGDFFRSVAFRYFHPDELISGEGTRLHGGRFAPVGVPAVYASREEETAFRQVVT